ncbi:pancreatic triacylglycerol lipase-like [Acanthaster planci]|uniref:Pancreatic triacylglycerol lipase-like n=1 Tax=Acanthaster planci TaxID=133434 RepID=A0A8B7YG59_ACAPL|nr:pancreatic triacylglycerol lipase-like [Acanthaster planci]
MQPIVLLLVWLPLVFAENRAKEVCYSNIGCFNYGYPFLDPPQRPLSWAPQSPSRVNPRFLLHTRHNPLKDQAQELYIDNPSSITSSHFDPSKETKLICHGFLESNVIEWDYWMTNMMKEFLNYADYNVIKVVWGSGSMFPYTQALSNTRIVGAETSRLIDKLRALYGISAASFHFIGHSLGSHIGGYVGERQSGLGRITGLDPAGPGFENTQPEVRLDPTDALFVDTIHSDAKNILELGFGMIAPVGHMDFYPNSGSSQPGCDQSLFEDFFDEGLIGGGVKFVACNHMRAHEFFTQSINNCPIYGFSCPNGADSYDSFVNGECFSGDVAPMGFHSINYKPSSGVTLRKYYTATTDTSPFCMQNPFQIGLHFDDPWYAETFKGWAYVTLIGGGGKTTRTKLNENSLNFKPGTDLGFVFNTNTDPGSLSELQFYWDHDFELLNPGDWPIFDDIEVFISKITIKGLSLQKSYTLCNQKPNTGINSNTVAYFRASYC